MLNLDSFSQNLSQPQYKKVSSNIKNTIASLVANYFSDKPMFEEKNISLYYYDDHAAKTNVTGTEMLALYVEINQPKNIKTLNAKLHKNNLVDDVHLTLKQMKTELKKLFSTYFNSAVMVGESKFGIVLKTMEKLNDEQLNYTIQVIPCFTHVNEQGQVGVKYYNNKENEVLVEYPKLALKNMTKKNAATDGLFVKYVTLMKNLYRVQKQVNTLPFEPFEVLAYNVPNTLITSFSKENLMQILNYLRNKPLTEFVTLDEQDLAFKTPYRALSLLYAGNALKTIEKAARKRLN